MRTHLLFFSSLLLLASAACSSQQEPPARLQVLSMMPASRSSITIAPRDGGQPHSMNIAYATPSGYRSFAPGRYTMRFRVDGELLLEHPFVLGARSVQTLLIAGLRPDSIRVNPQTAWYKARKIAAGSESHDPNGYLPQYIMLRDRWEGSRTDGLVRLVNAAPFAKTIRVKTAGKTLADALAYPRHKEPHKIKPGDRSLRFEYGKIGIHRMELPIRAGYAYTVVAGNPATADSLLQISTYRTPTRKLKKGAAGRDRR